MTNERLNRLGLILERMDVLYGRVTLLMEKEKQALIAFDYNRFYVLLREKDELLSAIKALDKDRLRIQDQFATLMDKDSNEVSLKFLADAFVSQGGPAEADGLRLLALRAKLAKTIDSLSAKLVTNVNFIERSVENLRGIAEHMAEAISGKPGASSRKNDVYTGKAKYQANTPNTGQILEKRL